MFKCAERESDLSKSDFMSPQPQYELKPDGSGEPYQSILELRRDKILNFAIDVPNIDFVKGFISTRFEDIMVDGFEFLIDQVETFTGMKAQCKSSHKEMEWLPRKLDKDFVRYINDHLDWKSENLVGYKKIILSEH